MSEDQLRKIFAEGKPDWLEEHSKACLPADEVIRLLDTQTFFELLKLPYPTDRNGVIDRLTSQRLIDQTGDTYAIRRLGGLLLANEDCGLPGFGRAKLRELWFMRDGRNLIPNSIKSGRWATR